MILAAKYRPKDFDELIGQESVSVSLKFALDHKRLAHAYLFSGLRGSGKTSSARIFARALICEKGPISKPCGECAQCISALENKNLDIIEMDAASNRGLEEIKALIEQTKYAPTMARFKVFIIDEVHMITPQAANALLKTLEEPPKYVKFILATTDPLKLPATILSRTQHFRFKQIKEEKIQAHLEMIMQKEGVSYEIGALKLIARSAGGSLRDTLTTLDQAIIYCEDNITEEKIAKMLGLLDPRKIQELFELILSANKDGVLDFLKNIREYEAANIIDEMVFFLKESFFAKSELFSLLIYERYFKILSRAKGMLKTCDDEDFVLCVMSFMLIEAANLEEISKDIITLARPATRLVKEISQEKVPLFEAIKSDDLSQDKNIYDSLIKVLFNRDYELGQRFQSVCELQSDKDNVLHILTHASGDDAKYLNNNFALIKQLFNQNFKGWVLKLSKKDKKPSTLQGDQNEEKSQNKPSFNKIIGKAKDLIKSDTNKEGFINKQEKIEQNDQAIKQEIAQKEDKEIQEISKEIVYEEEYLDEQVFDVSSNEALADEDKKADEYNISSDYLGVKNSEYEKPSSVDEALQDGKEKEAKDQDTKEYLDNKSIQENENKSLNTSLQVNDAENIQADIKENKDEEKQDIIKENTQASKTQGLSKEESKALEQEKLSLIKDLFS